MNEEPTNFRSPHLAQVAVKVKAQRAPYPIDVFQFGAQAVSGATHRASVAR